MPEDDTFERVSTEAEREEPRGHHSAWRWVLLAGAAGLVLWAALAGVTAVRAVADLRAGRAAALRAERRSLGALAEGRGMADLRLATRRFGAGRDRLDDPWMVPLRVVPVAGRQLRAATAMAGAAQRVTSVGLGAVTDARRILALPHRAGPDRIAQLRQLADLALRMNLQLTGLHLGPANALVGPVARAHSQLASKIAGLRTGLRKGAAAGDAMVDLLNGPRRYLVFAANNAEMRAGSGMFLSVGDLQTANGDLQTPQMGTVHDVPVPPGVPVEGDLGARWGWLQPSIEWRNLMLSPRFDASASLGARMWAAAGRGDVDGVLAVDPVALHEILGVTGPVTAGGRTFDTDNVLQEILHDQYVRYPVEQERREELSAIASATFTRLQQGDWSAGALADALARAARGRHVLVWSTRPAEEAAWEAAGVAGTLRGNSLLLAVINRGGNKLDQFLPTRASLELRTSGAHTDAVLRVTMADQSPARDPTYIIGPDPRTGLNAGDYLGIVAASLPGPATDGRMDGVGELAVAGADGPTRVIGGEVRMAAGDERTLVIRFRLPVAHGALQVEPSARVPAISWQFRGQHWSDAASHVVEW